uniref:Talin-2 (Trinotate prediction) n=1 Tax=Henneguya salminicola TaxID=69463 RepID=A0A6G3MJ19_HENSL
MVDETKIVGEIFKLICTRSGISIVDEYSLTLENAPEESAGTGTISKKDPSSTGSVKKSQASLGLTMRKIEERELKRMEKMKQKLHTDDEIRWVDHDKTMSEQGIDNSFILVLRRKYFYESNRNVFDPMEINILYNQCRDEILSGTLICTSEEIVKLASLQLQVQKGDYADLTAKNIEFGQSTIF